MFVYIVYFSLDFFVFLNLILKIFLKISIELSSDLKIKEGDNANHLF